MGTGAWRRACDRRRQHVHGTYAASEAIFSVDGDVERIQAAALATTPRSSGAATSSPASTRTISSSAAVKPGSRRARVSPAFSSVQDRGRAGLARLRRLRHQLRSHRQRGRQTRVSIVGPKHFDTLQQTDPDLVRAIWFGMFAFLSVPLLSRAELGPRIRRQLRLVDHRR